MFKLNNHYLSHNVEIIIDLDCKQNLATLMDINKSYFVIVDYQVNLLYPTLLKSFSNILGRYFVHSCEENKSIDVYQEIIQKMLDCKVTKDTTIIAIGGGIVTDISGYVAGTYKRGIPFISIPTTLLAQVDASIGGKCGLNFCGYKNQIGMFYHPEKIIIDPTFKDTLSPKDIITGLGEIIKTAIIKSSSLFEELFQEDLNWLSIIKQTIAIKSDITMRDEFEKGERFLLNYGHTFGHALESVSLYQISHGQAVLLGILKETNNQAIKARIISLYKHLSIDIDYSYDVEALKEVLLQDKKIYNQQFFFVKIIEIGQAVVTTMNLNEIERIIL